MEISMRSLTFLAALLLTGLSSGFFYAWAVSVIPGTKRVGDLVYLETMQSINRAILNPAFFVVFFGSLILLAGATLLHYRTGQTFWCLLAATATYLIGTFGLTAFGNVPLNDLLDVLDLGSLPASRLQSFRLDYESRWNRLHMVRTAFSMLSFLLALCSLFFQAK